MPAKRPGQNSSISPVWGGLSDFFVAGLTQMANENRQAAGLPPLSSQSVRPAAPAPPPQRGAMRADGKIYAGAGWEWQTPASARTIRPRLGSEIVGAFDPPPPSLPPPAAPAAPAPTALGSRNAPIVASSGRQRAERLALQQAEQQVRMDGQYRSPDYWKGEEGAAMLQLAQRESAPTDRPLAEYYRAQRAAGIGNQAEIVAGLTSGLEGDKAKNMAAWAGANPMLAMREYSKRFSAGSPSQGPADTGGFDWAVDAGEAVRAINEAEALKAGRRLVDASSLPAGEGVGFVPLPTSQAIAAADGAAGGGVRNTDQAVLAAMGGGALDGLRPGATSDDAILAGQAAGVLDSPSQAGGLVEDHLNRARIILRRGDRY